MFHLHYILILYAHNYNHRVLLYRNNLYKNNNDSFYLRNIFPKPLILLCPEIIHWLHCHYYLCPLHWTVINKWQVRSDYPSTWLTCFDHCMQISFCMGTNNNTSFCFFKIWLNRSFLSFVCLGNHENSKLQLCFKTLVLKGAKELFCE